MKLPAAQQPLLVTLATSYRKLTQLDTTDQLEEKKTLDDLVRRRARLTDAQVRGKLRAEEHTRELERARQDLLRLKKRLKADHEGLAAVTDPTQRRELIHDADSTTRRIDEMAKRVKERESVVAELTNSDELDKVIRQVDEARLAYERAAEDLNSKRDEARRAIDEIAAQLPADVVEEFVSQQKVTGVGAVTLVGRTCHGCSMVLSPVELDTVTSLPADEIARCPQCGTLLVRR